MTEMYLQPCQIRFLFKDELIHELKQTLNAIKLEEKGVYVQASTLGSLEALLEFLRTSEVPVSSRAQPRQGLCGLWCHFCHCHRS